MSIVEFYKAQIEYCKELGIEPMDFQQAVVYWTWADRGKVAI